MTDTPTFTGRLTFPATDTTDIVQRLQVCGQYTYHDEAILYGTVDALRRLRQVLDDAIDKGEGSAHFVPSDGECYQVLAFVRSDAEMDAIKPEYSFLIENSLQAIENDTLRARIAELERDAARLDWWFSFDKPKREAFVSQYLIGMRVKWSPDQWRDAIDAAMGS